MQKTNLSSEQPSQHNSAESSAENKPDAYILGGGDREMERIERVLSDERTRREALGIEMGFVVLRGMTTWESADVGTEDRKLALEEARELGATPVFVEHRGADELSDVVHIDHHDKNSHRPAAILQVLDRLGIEPEFVDKVVAANDSGYIPGIEKLLDEEYKDSYIAKIAKLKQSRSDAHPELTALDRYDKVRAAVIERVRLADRAAQGVTQEMESEAIAAIANMEDRNGLMVASVKHGRTSPVQDRLHGSWGSEGENLVIVCEADSKEKEVWFFGPGDIAERTQKHFQTLKQKRIAKDPDNEPPRRGIYHTVGGGTGFGKENETARCLVVADNAEEVIQYILKLEGKDESDEGGKSK